MLTFEAINIGIMSNPIESRNYKCAIKFAQKFPELLKKIAQVHPEYFVDGSILKLLRNNINDDKLIISLLSNDRDNAASIEELIIMDMDQEDLVQGSYTPKSSKSNTIEEDIVINSPRHEEPADLDNIIRSCSPKIVPNNDDYQTSLDDYALHMEEQILTGEHTYE